MKNIWYADNKDLMKWATLMHLSKSFRARRILQIAFYREEMLGPVEIDGQSKGIPQEVLAHFRNIRNIRRMKSSPNVPIEVFDSIFDDRQRQSYLEGVIKLMNKYPEEKLIVFLDPDIGLEPVITRHGLEHILEVEVREIFKVLKPEDVFVFYQHQTNRNGQEWINSKKNQLAKAIGLSTKEIKCAYGPKIAKDAVLFYVQKRSEDMEL